MKPFSRCYFSRWGWETVYALFISTLYSGIQKKTAWKKNYFQVFLKLLLFALLSLKSYSLQRSLNSFSSGWNLAAFPSICSTSGEFVSSHLCMDSICSCFWLWLSAWVHVWPLPWNSGKEMLHADNFTCGIVYATCWYIVFGTTIV